MTTLRDIDPETLELVARVDPLSDPRVEADAGMNTEAALRALLGGLPQRNRIAHPRPRRRPRHHRGRLVTAVGVPAVAAAGIVAALILTPTGAGDGGGGSLRVTGSRAGSGAAGPGTVQNAAYVLRRARSRFADEVARGVVLSVVDNSGFPTYRNVTYYDPKTDVFYQNDRAYDRRGRELFVNVDADVPVRDHMHFRTFSIDYTGHTWGADETVSAEPFNPHPAPLKHPLPPGAMSPPSAVAKALRSHTVTRAGTARVDGTSVIVLKARAGQDHITLYVDSRTYQPLRETELMRGKFHLETVTDVLPATRANLARAEDRPMIPSGFTRQP